MKVENLNKIIIRNHLPLLIILTLFNRVGFLHAFQQDRCTVSTYNILPKDESLYTLGEVIKDSILLELKIAGFQIFSSEGKEESLSMEEIFHSADASDSRVLIISRFVTDGEIINFKIDCYNTADRNLIISVAKEDKIGFFLDSVINEAMTDVITSIEKNIPIPSAVIEEPAETEAETYDTSKKILTFSLGIAPFLTTGDASRYFTSGLEFYMFGGGKYPLKNFFLIPGLFSSILRFNSEGIILTSENYLISMGGEIRAETILNNLLSIFVQAGTGISLLIVKTDETGIQSTTMPCLFTGIVVSAEFKPGMSGTFQLRYTAVFEESVLITGFSPTVGVNIKIPRGK